jgi:hypothetical protein
MIWRDNLGFQLTPIAQREQERVREESITASNAEWAKTHGNARPRTGWWVKETGGMLRWAILLIIDMLFLSWFLAVWLGDATAKFFFHMK